jgi:hypothetical protein
MFAAVLIVFAITFTPPAPGAPYETPHSDYELGKPLTCQQKLADGRAQDEQCNTLPKPTAHTDAAITAKDSSDSKYINPLIAGLINLVGIAATLSFAWGGIQYAIARDDPMLVSRARKRLALTTAALLMFLFLWALLQWLIPGGLH